MNRAIIRMATQNDIDECVEIWYKSSVLAHDFISQKYWQENKEMMRSIYLPSSELYVSILNNAIVGFVALVDNCLAAIFVLPECQGEGVGSLLVEQAKKCRTQLSLNVYKKNTKSVAFYKSKGFVIVSQSVDKATGEEEFLMVFGWRK